MAVLTHFVLYGGTAEALRLAHHASEDFHFFSAVAFQPAELRRQLPFASAGELLQAAPNTLTLRTAGHAGVKCSFFGALRIPQVAPPDRCRDTGVRVASLQDLLAVKLHTLVQRAEAKDYLESMRCLRPVSRWAMASHGRAPWTGKSSTRCCPRKP